jgi:hypothetical protein
MVCVGRFPDGLGRPVLAGGCAGQPDMARSDVEIGDALGDTPPLASSTLRSPAGVSCFYQFSSVANCQKNPADEYAGVCRAENIRSRKTPGEANILAR